MSKYKVNIEVIDRPSYITIQGDSVVDTLNNAICIVNDNMSTRDDYWFDTLEYKGELLLLKVDDDGISVMDNINLNYLDVEFVGRSSLILFLKALNKQLRGKIYLLLEEN